MSAWVDHSGSEARAVVLALPVPGAVDAQATGGYFFGGVVGLGLGGMSVGGESESQAGVILGAEFGSHRDGYRRWFVDASSQLFDVPNPGLEEAFRAVTVMVGRSFGSEVFFAPVLGIEYRSWSGPEQVEPSDLGLAIGISAGAALPVGRAWSVVPELRLQTSSIALEGSVSSRLVALRVAIRRMLSS